MEDDPYLHGTALSDAQSIGLCIATSLSGSLSIFGSLGILRSIITDKRKRAQLSSRFLVAISINDVISSSGLIMGCFLLPQSTELIWAFGSATSCTVAGVPTNFVTAAPIVSCNFSWYFLWTVRDGWRDHQFKPYERYMHAFPFVIVAVITACALASDGFNPAALGRFGSMTTFPYECEMEDDIECTRGLWSYPLGLSLFTIQLVFMIWGIRNTYQVYRVVTRRDTSSLISSGLSTIDGDNTDRSTQPVRNANQRRATIEGSQGVNASRRNRNVMIQAVLYMMAYLNSFLWPIILAFSGFWFRMGEDDGGFYFVILVSHFMIPLQGFLNYCIYFRRTPGRRKLLQYCCPPKRGTSSSSTQTTKNEKKDNSGGDDINASAPSQISPDDCTNANNSILKEGSVVSA